MSQGAILSLKGRSLFHRFCGGAEKKGLVALSKTSKERAVQLLYFKMKPYDLDVPKKAVK
jgi:hypothetical protein